MAETYCGKTCAACAHKETLNCSGCKTGPGRQYGGDCSLAKCCRDKGHEECLSCAFRGNCGTLRSREHMPEYRLRSIRAEEERAAALARRAPILGKWLWLLFWLIIPSSIASIMTNETILAVIPTLFIPGLILEAISLLAYGFILMQLAAEEDNYRTSAICKWIAGGVSVVLTIMVGGPEPPAWTLLLTLPAAIVSLAGEYCEYTAHSIVLTGTDHELSEKWTTLWKWFMGTYGAMIGSLVLLVIAPILGLLVILAASIGLVVVSILKLIYLYKTAKCFREYPSEVL